jgi:hypothetical protein
VCITEAALDKYKISVSYQNCCFEEVLEVYAQSKSAAEEIRLKIIRDNQELVRKAERLNVFVSKVIKDVTILPD